MTLTGRIVAVNPDGMVVISVDQTREQIVRKPYSLGNGTTGVQFGPAIGDQVHLDVISGIYLATSKAVIPQSDLGRVEKDDTTRVQLLEGELIMYGRAGQQVYFDSLGNIFLNPGPNGQVVLNYDQTNLRAVARDGDAVSGTDSHGDSFTGIIKATQTQVQA